MRHAWKPYSEKGLGSPDHRMQQLSGDVMRRCAACGAVQQYLGTGDWMRVGRRRWLPLAGRCAGKRPPGAKTGKTP